MIPHFSNFIGASCSGWYTLCQRLAALCCGLSAKASAPPVVFENFILEFLHAFTHDVGMPVRHGYNRVRRFCDGLYKQLVEQYLLAVKFGKKNHKLPQKQIFPRPA